MIKTLKALKSFLATFFEFLGLDRSHLKIFRSLSTIGIVIGFSATVSALLFPRFPAAFYSFLFGNSIEGFMSALGVEQQLFSLITGFVLLSFSAIVHFLLDVYFGPLDDVSSYSETSKIRMIVLSTFFLSFVFARVAVILSVIVGPETASGSAGWFTVNEIWINGYHIHHFFFGFLALTLAGWLLLFHKDFSKLYASGLYGTGLGIFMDEFGMLLTEGDYFATSSYFAAITFLSLLFVGVYWDQITAEEV